MVTRLNKLRYTSERAGLKNKKNNPGALGSINRPPLTGLQTSTPHDPIARTVIASVKVEDEDWGYFVCFKTTYDRALF